HLQDHVMHHELTHLVEMNHGPRFHALMAKAVNGREQENEKEIKNCDIAFCKF
ncbi:MAG: M48 family metallopeptidase, partial [Bacteroidaceae bacterium]|nr:M48 family metallopeptidase [Bacteroidaceae bacterium]